MLIPEGLQREEVLIGDAARREARADAAVVHEGDVGAHEVPLRIGDEGAERVLAVLVLLVERLGQGRDLPGGEGPDLLFHPIGELAERAVGRHQVGIGRAHVDVAADPAVGTAHEVGHPDGRAARLASTMGMPLTSVASFTWVCPATMRSTEPAGSSFARSKISPLQPYLLAEPALVREEDRSRSAASPCTSSRMSAMAGSPVRQRSPAVFSRRTMLLVAPAM